MRVLFFGIVIILASMVNFAWGALGETTYVTPTPNNGAMPIVTKNHISKLYVDTRDAKGVVRAVGDLQTDIKRVTGKQPAVAHKLTQLGEFPIIIGTIGQSELIDQLIAQGKLDVSNIANQWDAYHLELLQNPLPNVKQAFVIAGANKRGTSYGIYDLSETIGVSPWYYWADVPVKEQKALYILSGTKRQDMPKVKYRGIFLNDEAPALTNWVKENHGNYNHEFYEKVFELLLRLKANFLWPAMWNNAFADDDPLNMILADEYGIVMSTSHHEPMMRADKEWNRYGEGAWEYSTNPENLYKFWVDGAKRNKPYESIYTLGMRGQEDKPMSEGENIELLEKIVDDQRNILHDVFSDRPIEEVPQVWCLYKEVQSFYQKGMRVPDDVILLWTDDNWGNIRRLPTPEERDRKGGAGVYYHFDYVGGPRSYRWINTTPIAKIWEQMNLAYEFDANQIWITNVGDLKPMEFPIEFFLRMAWNPEAWPKERLKEFGLLWAEREFGAEFAPEIEFLMTEYTRHNGRRKPELMAPDTYSVLHYDEAERIEAEMNELVSRAEALYKKIPTSKKDAYFQLVLHPVKASANITLLNIALGRNYLYAAQGRAKANEYAVLAKKYFEQDAKLKEQYHGLNGGKWNHFMDQTHIGYIDWNNPEGDQMPATHHYSPGQYAEMGVAVQDTQQAWPKKRPTSESVKGKHRLRFVESGEKKKFLTIFNRGALPFNYKITTSDPWIVVDRPEGTVKQESDVQAWIDWTELPEGESVGAIKIKGTGWQGATIVVHANKVASDVLASAKGFVEGDGYISIEAANFARTRDVEGIGWQEIPSHGRTMSSISTFPVSDKSFTRPAKAPYVEYDVTFVSEGEVDIHLVLAPSWPIVPGRGLRYAVSIGNERPKMVDFLAGMDDTDEAWERSVEDGVRIGSSRHKVKKAGPNTIRLYMVDSAVTVQKILVDTGGLLPSYLGPEQSPIAH